MGTTRYGQRLLRPRHTHIRASKIRLFGDPRYAYKDGVPTLSIKLTAEVEQALAASTAQVITDYTVACDFVDGWAFGDALGFGVRSVSGWWTVTSVSLAASNSELNVRFTTRQCEFSSY